MANSPVSIAARQVELLLSHVPGVRDGDVEHIHEARVCTRRLREALPLTGIETGAPIGPARELVRKAGRALGAVRELDSLIELCRDLGDEHPFAAGPLAVKRLELIQYRERKARRLVKRLDRLDLETLREALRMPRPSLFEGAGGWQSAIVERVARRATVLGRALHRASGVYLPRRLHTVRVHLKKLRYAVEIAMETGVWRPAHWRKDASRIQELLGAIHDRQVLLDHLVGGEPPAMLIATLSADIARRHAQYLSQRDRVRGMIAACRQLRDLPASHWRFFIPGVAALLVPAGVALLRGPATHREAA